MKKNLFITILPIFLFSCKNQKVTSIELNNVQLTAEGPYYEGPTSFQEIILNSLKTTISILKALKKLS